MCVLPPWPTSRTSFHALYVSPAVVLPDAPNADHDVASGETTIEVTSVLLPLSRSQWK